MSSKAKMKTLQDNWAAAPRGVRLLGIDQGEKTLGLALSDPDQGVATPFKTIRRAKLHLDAAELAKIVKDYEVGGLIISYPLNMDGSEGPRCQAVRDYMTALAGEIDIPFAALWDERLSTFSAERSLIDDLGLRRDRRRAVIDAAAAQVILQGALDYLGQQRAM